MSSEEMDLGPVDIVVIGFPPDAPRTGDAIPIFVDMVDRGIIRVLDVLMVQKDSEGTVSGLEIADLDGDRSPSSLCSRARVAAYSATRTPPRPGRESRPAKPPC